MSRAWASGESSGANTAEIPPCAYFVFDSSRERFVMIVTDPCSATSSANVSPAIPLPMTRKSEVMGTAGG